MKSEQQKIKITAPLNAFIFMGQVDHAKLIFMKLFLLISGSKEKLLCLLQLLG
jgi:hypothetical protein